MFDAGFRTGPLHWDDVVDQVSCEACCTLTKVMLTHQRSGAVNSNVTPTRFQRDPYQRGCSLFRGGAWVIEAIVASY
jgi:hypothetical protein